MAKIPKNRYASTQDMLSDLEAVARGEPPVLARKAYDLTSLANLEKSGHEVREGGVIMVEASREQTIDFGSRTWTEKLSDPLVVTLSALLLMAVLIIIVLLLSR